MLVITRREGEEVVIGDPASPLASFASSPSRATAVRVAFEFPARSRCTAARWPTKILSSSNEEGRNVIGSIRPATEAVDGQSVRRRTDQTRRPSWSTRAQPDCARCRSAARASGGKTESGPRSPRTEALCARQRSLPAPLKAWPSLAKRSKTPGICAARCAEDRLDFTVASTTARACVHARPPASHRFRCSRAPDRSTIHVAPPGCLLNRVDVRLDSVACIH
jgi:hypothetical protein